MLDAEYPIDTLKLGLTPAYVARRFVDNVYELDVMAGGTWCYPSGVTVNTPIASSDLSNYLRLLYSRKIAVSMVRMREGETD